MNRNELLIVYGFGLGDCILVTPALRFLYEDTGNKCHICVNGQYESAGFFENCPYVEKIYYKKPSYSFGKRTMLYDSKNNKIGLELTDCCTDCWRYDKCLIPYHAKMRNIVSSNIESLITYSSGKIPSDLKTEVFISEEDKAAAKKVIKDIVGNHDFGFIQTKTSMWYKDLPVGFGEDWLRKNKKLKKFIEVGRHYDSLDYNINVQFEIMRLAHSVCLPDSVFYHACHAMGKTVDFVYFALGEWGYNWVKPLHEVSENVHYEL